MSHKVGYDHLVEDETTLPSSNHPPPSYEHVSNYGGTTGEDQAVTEKPPLGEPAPYSLQSPYSNPNTNEQYNIPGGDGYYQYSLNVPSTVPHHQEITVVHRESELLTSDRITKKDIGAFVYSICACLIFSWPIGIVAIVFSAMALNYRSKHGFKEKADRYTKYSLFLSVSATIVGTILLIILIVAMATS